VKPKKDSTIPVRVTPKLKRLIEEESDKDHRSLTDEVQVLLTEAIHNRKYNIKNYL